jgi:hypothetical protein
MHALRIDMPAILIAGGRMQSELFEVLCGEKRGVM